MVWQRRPAGGGSLGVSLPSSACSLCTFVGPQARGWINAPVPACPGFHLASVEAAQDRDGEASERNPIVYERLNTRECAGGSAASPREGYG